MILANSTGSIGLILVLVILAVIFFKVFHKFKKLKLDAVTIINGGVKCGKTTLAVCLAIRQYKRNLFRYKVRTFFQKIFKRKLDEMPLLYSNIPLKMNYVELDFDLLLRDHTRFAYKSVVLLSESSLVAGSMDYNSEFVNEQLTLFVKLFGHETRGGSLFIETQCLNDNHYAFKRGVNRYLWIHSLQKHIPFFLKYNIREMMYSDGDNNISNVFNKDVDEDLKFILVSKRIWKKFDSYCYSDITDDLPVNNNVIENGNAKHLGTKKLLRLKWCSRYTQSLGKSKKEQLKEVANNEIN